MYSLKQNREEKTAKPSLFFYTQNRGGGAYEGIVYK